MQIKWSAIVVGLALVALVAVAMLARGVQGAEPVKPQAGEGESETASMPYQGDSPVYATVRELAGASSVVILGTVQEVVGGIIPGAEGEPNTELPPDKLAASTFPVTEVMVKVERLLAGAGAGAGETILVMAMGARPVALPGESVVLFLMRGDDGLYRLAAEQQSVYPVRDGRLTLASEEAAHLPVGKAVSGVTVDQLAALVK